jgi:hypothetical protein
MDLTKKNAGRLHTMVSTSLITYKHYIPWADALIAQLEKPPYWLLELSTVKYKGDAEKVLVEFVTSEPFEEQDASLHNRDHIASLFLRYERREISWATFLNEAGRFSDCNQGEVPCEIFYELLNQFEDSDFDLSLERKQVAEVLGEYQKAVDSIRELYREIRQCSRK